jgi:glutamate--cysteine ligase
MDEKQDTGRLRPSDLRGYFEAGFKPPARYGLGIEYERFGIVRRGNGTLAPLPIDGPVSVTAILQQLVDRYHWRPLFQDDRLVELSRDGTRITLEPGGQMELSGGICRTMAESAREMSLYLRDVAVVSGELGVRWIASGTHPVASVEEIPWLLKKRYAVMKQYLPSHGRHAHQMMKGTCGQQVNMDFSDEADAMEKLRVTMALAAVVAALFANSAITGGRANGYLTERMAVWLDTDPDRAGLLRLAFEPSATFDDYIAYALGVPMFFLVRDGRYLPMNGMTFGEFLDRGLDGHHATIGDWETHLTTLFPDVRLKSYIEIRGTDSNVPGLALSHCALYKGLLYGGRDVLAAAWAPLSGLSWDERQALRQEICTRGLEARAGARSVREIAAEVIELARAGLAAAGSPDEAAWLAPLREMVVDRGVTPAEEALARFRSGGGENLEGVLQEMARTDIFP